MTNETQNTYEMSLKSDAGNPYAWMWEGMDYRDVGDIEAFVMDKARNDAYINNPADSGMTDAQVVAAWREGWEFDQAVEAVTEWVAAREVEAARAGMASRSVLDAFDFAEIVRLVNKIIPSATASQIADYIDGGPDLWPDWDAHLAWLASDDTSIEPIAAWVIVGLR
jgi:hypothetical protein